MAQFRFARVQPPRIHALAEQLPVHLRPEHLPRLGVEGVIEREPVLRPIRNAIRQVVEEEKQEIWKKAEILKKSMLKLGL